MENNFILIFLVWKDIKIMGTVTIMNKRTRRRFRFDLEYEDSHGMSYKFRHHH